MNAVTYKASLDRPAIFITFGSILLFAFGAFGICYAPEKNETENTAFILKILSVSFFVMVPFVCWLFSTSKYSINERALTIHRRGFDRQIAINSIVGVQSLSKDEMKGSIRAFAVGGLFGYFGKFLIPKFGSVSAYTTQNKNLVLVSTNKGEHILLSPDDPEFINELQKFRTS